MLHSLTVDHVVLSSPGSLRIAVIQSTYHADLNQNLVDACLDVLQANGLSREQVDIIPAPGTWEIPLLARALAQSGRYHGIAAFGVLVKGDTYHFDMIANEVARSLMETSVQFQIPVGFEVLAVGNLEQATRRASRNEHNKGYEAGNAILKAIASLPMVQALSQG